MIRADAVRVLLQLTKTDSEVSGRWRPFDASRWREVGKIAISLPRTTKAGIAVLNIAMGSAQPAAFSAQFNDVRVTCTG